MDIYIENEAEKELEFDYNSLINKVVKACLEIEKHREDIEISIMLSNDIDIKEINKSFRGIDQVTDVLSFPMVDYGDSNDFVPINPESGKLNLGDIVLSIDRVYDQANEFGHSRKREFTFLIVHSILHLLGYDHMEEEEAKIMEAKQKEIMEYLDIPRK